VSFSEEAFKVAVWEQMSGLAREADQGIKAYYRIGDLLVGPWQGVLAQAQVASHARRLSNWAGRVILGIYARLALDMDLVCSSPMPGGPKVIAANHPTTTDPFYLLAVVGEQMSILVTDMAFGMPGFGAYLRAAGHIPVVRGEGRTAFEQARRELESGQSVGIFPEGALSPLGSGPMFHRAHTGAVRLALSTGTPIVPVGVYVACERVHFTEVCVKDRVETGRWYLTGPYAVTVGEAIHLDGDLADRAYVRSCSQELMQQIARLARQSARRIAATHARAPVLTETARQRGPAEQLP
jgi:1-acyl-sn-glycerol-3-phosphate acyltransferase